MRVSPVSYNSFGRIFKRKNQDNTEVEPKQIISDTERQMYHKGLRRGAVAGVLSATVLCGGCFYVVNSSRSECRNTIVMPYNDGVTDIYGAARVFGSDIDTIQVSQDKKRVSIPARFDYLEDLIEQERSEARRLDNEDKIAQKYRYIQKLMEKQNYQQEIATVYTDGKSVYFKILPDDENSMISVEDFKKIFDIKDGALSQYEGNGISGDWSLGEYQEGGNQFLTSGTVLTVSIDDIDVKNINLNY